MAHLLYQLKHVGIFDFQTFQGLSQAQQIVGRVTAWTGRLADALDQFDQRYITDIGRVLFIGHVGPAGQGLLLPASGNLP